jgi:hypothetical protein
LNEICFDHLLTVLLSSQGAAALRISGFTYFRGEDKSVAFEPSKST